MIPLCPPCLCGLKAFDHERHEKHEKVKALNHSNLCSQCASVVNHVFRKGHWMPANGTRA